jgi:hypothetical protein
MARGLQDRQQPFPMVALDHEDAILTRTAGPQLLLAALQQSVEV